MKQVILQRLVIAAFALLTVPSAALAQSKTDKEEKKEKDKEVKTIIITRADGKDDKMTIVVDGDKITVNGKDIKDLKDVNVNVHTVTGKNHFRMKTPGNADAFSFNMNDDHLSLYSEDENRAMLGVNTDDHEKGAVIETVTEGSAAAKSGLKKGDVITKVGDAKVACSDDLSKAVRKHKPGEKVAVSYLRDGKEQNVTAELGKWKGIQMNKLSKVEMPMDMKEMDIQVPRTFTTQGNFYFSGRPKLGLSIQDTDDNKGVTVLEVEEESNAAKAGIKKDDIILSIDDKEVKGTEDVIKTVRENKEKYTFTFKVQRAGKVQNIEVKFPKKLKTSDL